MLTSPTCEGEVHDEKWLGKTEVLYKDFVDERWRTFVPGH